MTLRRLSMISTVQPLSCHKMLQIGRGHSMAPSDKGGAARVEGHFQGGSVQGLLGEPSEVLCQCGPLAHLPLRPQEIHTKPAKQGECCSLCPPACLLNETIVLAVADSFCKRLCLLAKSKGLGCSSSNLCHQSA